MLVKIPQKGDLRECGNLRGITLSLNTLKLFGKVLCNMTEPAIECVLREEQAGFRRNGVLRDRDSDTGCFKGRASWV